jgi:simple sugar transport system ATP-binding protein
MWRTRTFGVTKSNNNQVAANQTTTVRGTAPELEAMLDRSVIHIDSAPTVAEAIDVSKRFGASQAIRDVSLTISAGESRALVGRNGAGKSTLVAMLTGMIAPDSGRIRLAGQDAPGINDPQKWRDRVACVYQRSTLIPDLTVAENLFLNSHPTRTSGWINWSRLRREAKRVLEEWGLEVDVNKEAGTLSVENRHIVEIARALRQGTRFIVLDEPTAELEGREASRLFARIMHLQKSGVAFLYISHYLEEIYEICDSATVLRDGEVVASGPLAEMPKERIVSAMVGDIGRSKSDWQSSAAASTSSPPCLEVRNLSFHGLLQNVSFTVSAGECVGLAGLLGSGKEVVGDAIAGLVRPSAGAILVCGRRLPFGQVSAAQSLGVGYVPRDRRARGLLPQLSVAENITVTIAKKLGVAGLILPHERDRHATELVQSLEIVASSLEQPISQLSGGNQQKAVLGRALAAAPKLLVLAHPTQGVDIASKEALFGIIDKARTGGTAVLIVSDDLDELIVCSRVLVLFKGKLRTELGAPWQDETLVAAIEGV